MTEATDRWAFPNLLLPAAGFLSAGMGISALAAWRLHYTSVLQVSPASSPLQYNTALCFAVCGIALFFVWRGWRGAAITASAVLLTISGVSLLEHTLGVGLGIDELFFKDYLTARTALPGRMDPASGLCLALASFALGLMCLRKRHKELPATVGLIGALIVSLGAATLAGYATGIAGAFGWGQFKPMSLLSAAGCVLVGIGAVGFSWAHAEPHGAGALRWAVALIDIVVMTMSLFTWQAVAASDHVQMKKSVRGVATHVLTDIRADLESRVQALIRKSRRSESPEADWADDSRLIMEHYHGLNCIYWIDASNTVRRRSVSRGVAAIPPGTRLQGALLSDARRAQAGRDPILSSAHVAGTAGGTLEVLVPTYRQGQFTGLLMGVFGIKSMVQPYLSQGEETRGLSAVLLDHGTIIAGPEGVLTAKSEWAQDAAIEDYGLAWRVRVWPSAGWLSANQSIVDELVFLAGFSLTCLLGLTVRLAQISRTRTKEAETANRELHQNMMLRVHIEAELRASEEKFRTSVDTMLDGFGIVSAIRGKSGRIVDFLIEYVNEAACAISHGTKELLIGKHLGHLMPFPAESGLFEEYCRVVETGKPLVREIQLYEGPEHNRRIHRVFDIRVTKLGDGFVVAWLDITERRHAEEARRQFEARYRDLFERVPVGIYRTTGSGRILEANPALLKLLGYPDLDSFRAVNAAELYPHREDRLRYLSLLDSTEVIERFETQLRRYDGSIIWVLDSARAVRDAAGRLVCYEGTLENITEQKQATDQLKRSLVEKETLLKEIHHRVKNNLQVVSSLLSLQSGYIRDGQALEMFKESQNRVRSMALIHEKLYKSKDLARIDFARYIQNLSTHLFRSYGVSSENIRLNIEVEDVQFTIDEAIPCGLIVNELVSNSLKHAFPQGRAGQIRICLYASGGRHQLVVGDNGVGLPVEFDLRAAKTLGLQLVNTLTEQLGGTVSIRNEQGSEFTVSFPA